MVAPTSMLDKWEYLPQGMVCFAGHDEISYKKAAEFLGRTDPVEDWGGGTGWAKKYFDNYKNIDGAKHPNVDVQADLQFYKSKVENILMRQVLCYTYGWEKVLENVKRSFTKKFCLVINNPLAEVTTVGSYTPVIDAKGDALEENKTPDIFFNKKDIMAYFPESEFIVKEETVNSDTPFGQEWILYVTRR